MVWWPCPRFEGHNGNKTDQVLSAMFCTKYWNSYKIVIFQMKWVVMTLLKVIKFLFMNAYIYVWLNGVMVIFIPRHTLVFGYYVIPFGVCPSVRPSVHPSVHTLVSWYYVIPFGVCPSVRPCSPFPIDNFSIYSRIFFKFCIHIVIGDEWYGIVNGQNLSIFNGVTALFCIGKMVSGLLFLYCSWYLNETSHICCTSKVTYCD